MCEKNELLKVASSLVNTDNFSITTATSTVNNCNSNCTNGSNKLKNLLNNNSSSSNHLVVPQDKNNLELVKKFVFGICQEYLSGVWKKIELDDFVISKPK